MSGINPAWKSILDKIPAEFHNQVIPTLEEWDKGVQQKFTEIHGQYEELKPFKKFVDNNIAPDYAEHAIALADELQRDPQKVVGQINEAWDLGYVSKEEAEKLGQPAGNSTGDNGDLFGNDDNDIFKDPRVQAMQKALEEVQGTIQTQAQRDAEAEAIRKFEEELDALEQSVTNPSDGSDPKPFNRMFVTALMAQGIDADEAVKQYHQVLAGAIPSPNEPETSGNDDPPPVMGNGGTVGSGTPDGSVDFGSLSRSGIQDTVEQYLAAAAQDSGQG